MNTNAILGGVLAGTVRIFTGARPLRRAKEAGPGGPADGPPPSDPSPLAPATSPGPRIYFANHTSNLDFVVLWSVLDQEERKRTRPVAAHDYWSQGTLRPWIAREVFRAVLVERKHVTRENNPVEHMLAVLEAGDSLIIFPEGGRQGSAVLGPFKSGLYHLAKRNPAAELVPVYIENLNRVLPKGEILALPLLCSVSFGDPIRLQEGEGKDEFLTRARETIHALAQ